LILLGVPALGSTVGIFHTRPAVARIPLGQLGFLVNMAAVGHLNIILRIYILAPDVLGRDFLQTGRPN